MEKNLKIIIIPVIILAISLILPIFVFNDQLEDNTNTIYPKTSQVVGGMPTDPAEFTNQNYRPYVGRYVTTDPLELEEKAHFIAKGTLVDVLYTQQMLNAEDPPVFFETGELVTISDITFFTIKIDEILKGSINDEEFSIRSVFPSKIRYEKDDTILVLFDEKNGGYVLNGGPYSMFKLKKGLAIGHEKTFPEDTLLNQLK